MLPSSFVPQPINISAFTKKLAAGGQEETSIISVGHRFAAGCSPAGKSKEMQGFIAMATRDTAAVPAPYLKFMVQNYLGHPGQHLPP